MTTSDRLKAVAGVVVQSARLGPRDGAVCLLAWTLLHATTLRLRLARVVPGRRAPADPWNPHATPPAPGLESPPAVARLARLFGLATRHRALGAWCLPRAVALRRLLRLHGFEAEMALGLRQGADGPKGHAWVVYHGVVLDQDTAFAGSFVRCEVG